MGVGRDDLKDRGRVVLGPLNFDVLRYQFPRSEEYWDANWVVVDIQCRASDLSIKLQEPCLLAGELHKFHDDIGLLLAGAPQASLDPMEPYFRMKLKRDEAKDLSIAVNLGIWLGDEAAPRQFAFTVTDAQLRDMQAQLAVLCARFPVKVFDDV